MFCIKFTLTLTVFCVKDVLNLIFSVATTMVTIFIHIWIDIFCAYHLGTYWCDIIFFNCFKQKMNECQTAMFNYANCHAKFATLWKTCVPRNVFNLKTMCIRLFSTIYFLLQSVVSASCAGTIIRPLRSYWHAPFPKLTDFFENFLLWVFSITFVCHFVDRALSLRTNFIYSRPK